MLNNFSSTQLNLAVDQVKNLDQLYEVTNKTLESVKKTYPNILCKSGCNACCKTYGSPAVFAIEWERIKSFLDNSDADFKEKVKKSLNEVKDLLRKTIKEHKNPDPEKIVNNIKCPFLQEEVCSVYSIRPLICRMFGSFVANPDKKQANENVIFTCEMEKDRWNREIEENKLKSLVLPNRDYFYNKLEELNNNEKAVFLINYIDDYFK